MCFSFSFDVGSQKPSDSFRVVAKDNTDGMTQSWGEFCDRRNHDDDKRGDKISGKSFAWSFCKFLQAQTCKSGGCLTHLHGTAGERKVSDTGENSENPVEIVSRNRWFLSLVVVKCVHSARQVHCHTCGPANMLCKTWSDCTTRLIMLVNCHGVSHNYRVLYRVFP